MVETVNNNYKILVVDDDSASRSIVKYILSNEGYEVIEATGGSEGMRKVVIEKPDLILLDLVMPGVNGFDVCKMLKAELEESAIPVIIFSSKIEKEDIIKGLETGACDYIVKPVDAFELRARVKAQLRLKHLYDEADAEKKDLATLLTISQAVSSTLHSSEILHTIVKSVAEVIEVVRCSIVKIGKKEGVGYVLTTYENPNIKYLPLELGKYPEIRRALEEKDAVIVGDIDTDPLMDSVKESLKKLKFTSLMIIPIMVREEVVGTLFLRTSRKERSFTQREISFCRLVANLAGNALANAHLFESMELANLELGRLAITDGLTGVHNHRHFRTRLDDEFSRAQRYGTPLSLIMLDIDYFKNINDAFGHGQGDIVLREIADVVRNCVRKTDMLARYGGEEFAVLLPQTDKDGAVMEGERIRNAVKDYKCTGPDRCIMVTVSLGISTFPSSGIKNADDMVGKADDALYEAKNSGRNRTVAA